MSAGPLRCSLVIATLDDAGSLDVCLASLAAQENAPRFEVLVIDQNGDDRLAGVIGRFSEELEIRHERVAFRGASRARNLGARLAAGAWLGFPDDDCRLLPDALAALDKAASGPGLHVVTGQTVDEAGNPNVLRWKGEPSAITRWTMFGCVTEATMFVRREIFLLAGGFDERFGPGTGFPAAEGIDLMNRLFDLMDEGGALYCPQIKMRHPTKIPPWNRWAVGRFHAYAMGNGALIAKTPQSHMLWWGARTLMGACVRMFSLEAWRSAAFGARILGLLRGFLAFHIASRRV